MKQLIPKILMKNKYAALTFALLMLVAGKSFAAPCPKLIPPTIAINQDDDVVSNLLQSIPSPLELSQLIKDVGTDYNSSFLNATTNVNNYNTSYRQALNLGVYSTDLGYCNLYSKNQDILNYLSSVKDLANDLGIGAYFDAETIKKLANDRNNLEALLNTTQQNLEKINTHLREEKREYQSILLLTGGWVEAVYLATQVHKQTVAKGNAKDKADRLKEKIGEQKLALDQIVLILEIYKSKPNFEGLYNQLKELQKVYNKVQIVTKKGGTKTVVVNGEVQVQSLDTSTVTVAEADFQEIVKQVQNIRTQIVK
jgi:hypothetical protein